MRLTTNRFLAAGIIPTLMLFAMNRRNTDANRAARKAYNEQRKEQEQQERLQQQSGYDESASAAAANSEGKKN